MDSRTTTPGPAGASPRALAIVPARLGSTRLPRKVLLRETGRYLFEHTVANARRCGALERVILATDSEEVLRAAAEVDVEAVMTDPAHPSGTDRVREALAALAGPEPEVVVNVQADEPDLDPGDLTRLVAAFRDPQVRLATLSIAIDAAEDFTRPEVVKVVTDAAGRALYFSRAPIPARGHGGDSPRAHRHLGVYAYRPEALHAFCDAQPGVLEQTEKLEQLRWLEAGGTIHVLPATRAPRGIDTPEDYRAFVSRCRRAPLADSPLAGDPPPESSTGPPAAQPA
ncbi:3-deoxy-manno-octulosonate cytidylyltransferase [Engelhardtia mirabilis]|uniref:3-deoxy-manno-octulosonate cytidylyltransferase n=1 Tax=Engelhardtia mirabilis TaxID=2528011 RepID=UPI00119E1144